MRGNEHFSKVYIINIWTPKWPKFSRINFYQFYSNKKQIKVNEHLTSMTVITWPSL